MRRFAWKFFPEGWGFLGCWLVPVVTDFSYWLLLKYGRAPDPLRGSRGRWPWHAPPRWPLLHAQRLRARWSAFPSESSCLVCPLTLSPLSRAATGWGTPRGTIPRRATGLGTPRGMCPRRKRAPPEGRPGGRLTQAPAGTNPKTGQAADTFLTSTSAVTCAGYFLTLTIHWLSFPVPYRLLEVVVLRWLRLIGWLRFYGLYDSFVFLSSPLRAPLLCSIGCLPFRISLTAR